MFFANFTDFSKISQINELKEKSQENVIPNVGSNGTVLCIVLAAGTIYVGSY